MYIRNFKPTFVKRFYCRRISLQSKLNTNISLHFVVQLSPPTKHPPTHHYLAAQKINVSISLEKHALKDDTLEDSIYRKSQYKIVPF